MSDNEMALRSGLARTIAGRTVSVVGNASSLLKSRHGPLIDSGCVLRMNAGVPIDRRAQGHKVDIHCFGTRHNLALNMRHRRRHWLMRRRSDYFDNALSVWMALVERDRCDDPRQLFYPSMLGERLAGQIGARPSVGLSALNMLSELTEAEVRIFGFDFKATYTFYRKIENRGPHDWDAEQRFVLALVEKRRWKLFS